MTDTHRPIIVQGMGIILPGIASYKDLRNYYTTDQLTNSRKVTDIPNPAGINKRETRRMSHLTNLAMNAAEEAMRSAHQNTQNGAVFIGLTHGSTSLLCEFHNYLFDFGPDMASPNAFSHGVTSAPLGVVSKYLHLTQGGTTFVGYENCGMEVLNSAAFYLQCNTNSFCLAGAAEEYSSIIEHVYSTCKWFEHQKDSALPPSLKKILHEKKRYLSEGSVFFALSSEEAQEETENNMICYFKPVENIHTINTTIDLIISGMYGGPQDTCEFNVISALLDHQHRKPGLLFSKLVFGETFAAGTLVSSALAWDILVNYSHCPCYKLENKENRLHLKKTDLEGIKTILVISADRCKKFSAGIFSTNFII